MEDNRDNKNTDHQDVSTDSMMRTIIIAVALASITFIVGWVIAQSLVDTIESTPILEEQDMATSTLKNPIANSQEPTMAEKEASCELVGGEFNEYQECLGISDIQCETLGGRWEECASACRHDSSAEFCTMQCVQFCKL
ncbi:MAG: hypothetical protein ACKKL4_01850 [Patescibacteria group bacterium]